MDKSMKEKKIMTGISIFLCLVFICSFVFLISMYRKKGGENGYACIYQDGILVKTVSLEKEDTFFIKGKNGAYNKISVKDGSIGIIEASCPDFLCGRMGYISKGPIPITCLPNRLVIEIESEREAEEVDGVVY